MSHFIKLVLWNITSFYFHAQQSLEGEDLLIIEASRPHSAGILWTSDRHGSHNTHNGETSVFPAGFEPAIPASKLPHTHALDRAATGIGAPRQFKVNINPKKEQLFFLSPHVNELKLRLHAISSPSTSLRHHNSYPINS